ncbi:uncharacterized protein F4822DRAFT_145999 [Hypoxylon trugodes]|uniref:uncharacterized protein n=1 Tax=Hypoxylon trugodes TaxID=326681 RepID=UPI0021911040|nr:uncharacterized protein F4822DRAFT_145999 [Hypoxylon trugodes]KAI1392905.1 hypothetical protein F4822DRAFT_145999 [Hypoxylon trugodes]
MFMCHGDEDGYVPPGEPHPPHVTVPSNLTEIKEEIDQMDEECFGWTAARHYLEYITLEEYFDRLIDHIREGGTRHKWDKSNSNIPDVLNVDLIAGAFKARMLKRNLGRISHADGEQLKALCVLFYREADLTELQRRVELEIGVTLASLPPWIMDILGIIAYARRHVDVLEHLVKNYRASSTRAKSSFDLLGVSVLSSRKGRSEKFQHSANTPLNREIEYKMWTTLLNSEPNTWLHYPMYERKTSGGIPEGLYYGLHWLADYWRGDHELRTSPAFADYLRALGARGIILSAVTIARFLSVTEGGNIDFTRGGPFVPVGIEPARLMLECFPLGDSMSKDYPNGDSANLALPITQWPIDNPDRLVVLQMLLEQGLVVDGKVAEMPWGHLGPQPEHQKYDTCLIKAAERGDIDMVKLLLRYGAKRDMQGAHGHTAAQRAKEKGHTEVANYLDGL